MKRARKPLFLVALSAVAVIVVRAALNLTHDVQHYNRLREMSGEGSIWEEVPEMLRQIGQGEKGLPAIMLGVIRSVPEEAAWLIRAKSM